MLESVTDDVTAAVSQRGKIEACGEQESKEELLVKLDGIP